MYHYIDTISVRARRVKSEWADKLEALVHPLALLSSAPVAGLNAPVATPPR